MQTIEMYGVTFDCADESASNIPAKWRADYNMATIVSMYDIAIGKVVPYNVEGTRWVASYEPFGPCGTFGNKDTAIREVIERWAGYQARAHQARQQG